MLDGTRLRGPGRKDNQVHIVASQAKNIQSEKESQRTISLSSVIALAPSSSSFGGWGPKVPGNTTLLRNWN